LEYESESCKEEIGRRRIRREEEVVERRWGETDGAKENWNSSGDLKLYTRLGFVDWLQVEKLQEGESK
jgi:hypothetical protein